MQRSDCPVARAMSGHELNRNLSAGIEGMPREASPTVAGLLHIKSDASRSSDDRTFSGLKNVLGSRSQSLLIIQPLRATRTPMLSPTKTSVTSPLRIAEIQSISGQRGFIGITLCPGKKQRDALSGNWDRDLAADLNVIQRWGASAVVSLIQDFEYAELDVTGLGEGVLARNMEWYPLPIEDMNRPMPYWEQWWSVVGPRIQEHLQAGRRVLVHCKGGLGRAGTVASRLLIDQGMRCQAAIHTVRKARHGAIEREVQEEHLHMIEEQVACWRRSECRAALNQWITDLSQQEWMRQQVDRLQHAETLAMSLVFERDGFQFSNPAAVSNISHEAFIGLDLPDESVTALLEIVFSAGASRYMEGLTATWRRGRAPIIAPIFAPDRWTDDPPVL